VVILLSDLDFSNVNHEDYILKTVDATSIVFWRWDAKNDLFFISDRGKQILGYDDLGGAFNNWSHIWHPNEQNRMLKLITSTIDSNNNQFATLQRFKHSDDSYHWYYSKGIIQKSDEHVEVSGFSVNADELTKIYAYFNLSLESSHDYISATNTATWYWNIQSGETVFNERWAELIGYTLEELSPISINTWTELMHPDDRKIAEAVVQKAVDQNEEYYENTFRMMHKDGSYRWVLDRGKVIDWDKNQKPLIMVGTHHDITKSKELELRLAEDERRYKDLIESSYDIIYTMDLNYNITFISRAWERLLGHTIDDILNQSFIPYIHPDDVKVLGNFLKEISKRDRRLESKTYRLKHKDGSWRYFSTNALSMKDEHGKVVGFSGTARDITDQKLLEETLSFERDTFKKTLFSVGDGIIATDQKGLITMINPVAKDFYNERSKFFIGKKLDKFFRVEDINEGNCLGNIALHVIKTKKAIQVKQGMLVTHKNDKFPIEYSASPIEDIHGIEDGVVIVFRDISERIEKQKEIEFLSYHDYLTGLYNRRYYEDYIKKLDQKDLPISLMLLDINDLKKLNDTFGHHVGDQLIQKVSSVIDEIASDATVCRVGGDEFVILFEKDVDLYDIENRIKEKLIDMNLFGLSISVSIGFNKRLDKYDRIVDVQKRADKYLYECKARYHQG
jgi:diguanylate cyclase (GGDEF)-like protein/PAS domain S-box-containing protein